MAFLFAYSTMSQIASFVMIAHDSVLYYKGRWVYVARER